MVHLKDVEDDKKMMVVQFLLQNSKDGKPKYGKMKDADIKFNLGRRTITRFWAEAKKQKIQGQLINLTSTKRYTPRFTKCVQINIEQIQSLELCRRGTIRKLAFGIKCSKSTVGRWVNLGLIKAHVSAIKPDQTAPNKLLRPIFDENGNVIFDGKISIFPFIEKVPAKRRSKNTSAGTLETKPLQSITTVVTKECFINKAKSHISDLDPEFRQAASQKGFDIRIVHQPPYSPDTNVNDLGWFRAIQSIQEEAVCTTVDQLVNAGCMIETMRMKGHNAYKVPHMSKDALIRQNALPITLEVDKQLVNECISHMIEAGEEERMQHLIEELGYGYEAQIQLFEA
ncbi:uncharacterized protein LOC131008200 [Salvia miltiorrhiza]|uniref:uncharacterized protein LOC131008200 n=1 Tax=Salvia miltiorrhiza TaxID=226208 RepID=UPI0025ABCA65|nr:uncharacterized protein LOC131008200 [Salvia miltiorrhiza]